MVLLVRMLVSPLLCSRVHSQGSELRSLRVSRIMCYPSWFAKISIKVLIVRE